MRNVLDHLGLKFYSMKIVFFWSLIINTLVEGWILKFGTILEFRFNLDFEVSCKVYRPHMISLTF